MTRRAISAVTRGRRFAPLALAGGAAYAGWASGVVPFTWRAYVAVGVPVLVATAAVVRGGWHGAAPGPTRTDPGPSWRALVPWAALAAVAAGLEAAALALGGRSATVPTLSTVVDRALVWRLVRFALFCVWLAPVLMPALRAPSRLRPAARRGRPEAR